MPRRGGGRGAGLIAFHHGSPVLPLSRSRIRNASGTFMVDMLTLGSALSKQKSEAHRTEVHIIWEVTTGACGWPVTDEETGLKNQPAPHSSDSQFSVLSRIVHCLPD